MRRGVTTYGTSFRIVPLVFPFGRVPAAVDQTPPLTGVRRTREKLLVGQPVHSWKSSRHRPNRTGNRERGEDRFGERINRALNLVGWVAHGFSFGSWFGTGFQQVHTRPRQIQTGNLRIILRGSGLGGNHPDNGVPPSG